jgi:hypothetical protein
VATRACPFAANCGGVSVIANLHYVVHWPTHGGYNFISGPLADITLITAFASTLWL